MKALPAGASGVRHRGSPGPRTHRRRAGRAPTRQRCPVLPPPVP